MAIANVPPLQARFYLRRHFSRRYLESTCCSSVTRAAANATPYRFWRWFTTAGCMTDHPASATSWISAEPGGGTPRWAGLSF